jgi:hypothetical protein
MTAIKDIIMFLKGYHIPYSEDLMTSYTNIDEAKQYANGQLNIWMKQNNEDDSDHDDDDHLQAIQGTSYTSALFTLFAHLLISGLHSEIGSTHKSTGNDLFSF